MKKAAFVIISLALSFIAFAQDDKYGENKEECLKYISYYEEYFKQKAYDDAIPNWRQAYHFCPRESRQTILTNGATLMRRLIMKNAKNPEYKKALIDSLMTLHEERAQYFPKYSVSALNNKGQDVFNFIKGDNKRVFDEYSKIIEANAEKTKATLLVHQFNAAVALYKEGTFQPDEVLSVYQKNNEMLKSMESNDEVLKARGELENRFVESKIATCDNLLAIYTPKFEAEPQNLDLAKNIVKMLSITDGGTDTELFLKAVTTMHSLEPSYQSAYYLYRLNSSRGNVNEAINYIEEAIAAPESDDRTDAGYLFELATFSYKNGRSGKAFEAAKKSASLDESYAGKSYFLIANIWGSTKCGGDEIARRSPYWVAVDYLMKAKAADASLTEEANRYIGMYSKYYPETGEAFMYDIKNGQSYTVNCGGMSATTTVRTQK